ncbi:MAG: hypothetical protein AAB861_01055 [Patescibacteria group bacterium]
MTDIIPGMIPQNLNIIREKLEMVKDLVKKVQIDLVDGKYAPPKTWPFNGDQYDQMVKMVRGEEKFPHIDDFLLEIDMLVLHPIEYLSDLLSIGARSFIIHIDSTDHVKECLKTIKDAGCEAGLGIKPSVDSALLDPFLFQADFIQFMGNDRVGYNGVELDSAVLSKIKNFHLAHSFVPIQIDIGVNLETIPKLKAVGVSRFISGSAVFTAPDIKVALTKLQNA